MVFSQSPSDPSIGEKYGDNDYNVNVLLARGPLNLNEVKQTYWAALQGELVAENPAIHSIGKGYPQTGDDVNHLKALHCEFEGDGVHNALLGFYLVLALLLAALAIPGFIIVPILIALLLLRNLFGAEPGAPGSGTPLDIDPSLGSLSKRDVVVVRGQWVYDSGHAGWNEIHPVRDCQIIGRLEVDQPWDTFKFNDQSTGFEVTLDSDANLQRLIDFWCGMIDGAHDAEDGGSREDPVNGWGIHPTVDGCKKPIIT
jgi:hypothetical protein